MDFFIAGSIDDSVNFKYRGTDKLTNFVPAKWGFDASEYRK